MSATNDGGPAFPHSLDWGWSEKLKRYEAVGFSGMTMRDYFAAAALQGMLAQRTSDYTPEIQYLSWYAYRTADAMLKAREVKP